MGVGGSLKRRMTCEAYGNREDEVLLVPCESLFRIKSMPKMWGKRVWDLVFDFHR